MEEQINFYQQKLSYEIDSWDLSEALKQGVNIIVIDARSNDAYKAKHIPSAINLPHREMNEESTDGFDRSTLYITYCDGIGCNASTKGALNMAKLGFKVKELLGGLDWWVRDGYETNGENPDLPKDILCGC